MTWFVLLLMSFNGGDGKNEIRLQLEQPAASTSIRLLIEDEEFANTVAVQVGRRQG